MSTLAVQKSCKPGLPRGHPIAGTARRAQAAGFIGDILALRRASACLHARTRRQGSECSSAAGDVPVHRTSRGGDVTYHGPGQLVVYPIVDLRSKLRKDVHRYVRNLEQSAIRTLADFGIATTRRPPHTGIWIDDQKNRRHRRRCAALHHLSWLALNVNTDLSYFQRIIPCGLAWAEVTSMQTGTWRRTEFKRRSTAVSPSLRRNFRLS